MRLIDADEFKKQIAAIAIKNNYPEEKANAMCELVDAQPTAYDVEAVCRKLFMESEGVCGYEMVDKDTAGEIIRSGGI